MDQAFSDDIGYRKHQWEQWDGWNPNMSHTRNHNHRMVNQQSFDSFGSVNTTHTAFDQITYNNQNNMYREAFHDENIQSHNNMIR